MKVFITREIPVIAYEMLRKEGYEVEVYPEDKAIPKDVLIKKGGDADALITLLSDKIDSEIINSLKKCKVVANYAVGYNNIEIESARAKHIEVTNTPDVLTDSTADLAILLLLACARQLNEGEEMMRAGAFTGWKPKMLLGIELKGKTLGIIGAGRIGAATAIRGRAFGCNIVYYNRSRNEELERKTGGRKVELNTLIEESDFISVHLPLTENTFHLLNKNNMKQLKKSAIIINTARGEIIEEKELISLLEKKEILAAGFDVYENEPAVNPELLKLKNVVLLPHLGSATIDSRNAMAEVAAKNIIAVLSGKPAINSVIK